MHRPHTFVDMFNMMLYFGGIASTIPNLSLLMKILTFSPTQHRTEADQQNESMAATDDQAELLRWHHRLGHIPFSTLKTWRVCIC